eukprot:TRINITY_DN8103_c0_g1_i2.p1 TRINITY_DN8103_c0_g1~~TRINITY_DN8103_c0_g1_i2.p1  ORF type:complete len:165 (+),score=30.13 TRINITY_DN8103_c0_g1_i2:50-544(+)
MCIRDRRRVRAFDSTGKTMAAHPDDRRAAFSNSEVRNSEPSLRFEKKTKKKKERKKSKSKKKKPKKISKKPTSLIIPARKMRSRSNSDVLTTASVKKKKKLKKKRRQSRKTKSLHKNERPPEQIDGFRPRGHTLELVFTEETANALELLTVLASDDNLKLSSDC